MVNVYDELCALYATDSACDLEEWRAASALLDELVEALRITLGLSRPLDAIFLSALRDPEEHELACTALEANAERSWTALLTVILERPRQAIDWQGAHFRFQLEIKQVMEHFYAVTLWPGGNPIRVRFDDAPSYRALATAIVHAIEAKIRDPKAPGPERFAKRELRPPLEVYFRRGHDLFEEPISHVVAQAVPRRGDSLYLADGYYRVDDVVWSFDARHTVATVIVSPQPAPARG